MGAFFDFFGQHATGVFVFLVLVAILTTLGVWTLQKLCWVMQWGRFRPVVIGTIGTGTGDGGAGSESSLAMVITAFFAKLIDEFRHLLALLIFLLFAVVLIYGIWAANKDLDKIQKVIQAIVASLGGLVGSIMGYYFGEARGKTTTPTVVQAAAPPAAPAQPPPHRGAGPGGITPPPQPPAP